MGAKYFNIYFKNVPGAITSLFTDDSTLLWKGQESIYIRLNSMKFTGRIFYDFLHCYQIKLVWTSQDLIGSSSKLLVNILLIHFYISLMTTFKWNFSWWKLARVTSVFKNNGDVDVLSNYRPISVIGHIAKMVEQLVRSQLVRYLEEHTFITPDQSASPKNHSTQTSLHRVIDDCLDNINEDQITGVCLLDISKCFDTINHSILLQKLSMYGINTKIWNGFLPISIIGSKLCSVTMNFRVLLMLHVAYRRGLFLDHFYSYCSLMLYHNSQLMGVYQIYMQMTRWFIHQEINILEVQQKLQQCVKNISSWYKINRLKINIDKTKVTLIGSKAQLKYSNVDDFILSYDDTPLELVENVKYLDIFKNCDISWDFHVRRLCQSTYYHISLPRRLRRIFPMNLLLQVYKSYIQPRLDYGITLYGCNTQKNIGLFQRVQMVTTPEKRVQWTFIFLLSTKRYTEIVLYIRVVNFGMNCQIW